MTDYKVYKAKGKERTKRLLTGFLISSALAVLFYKSVVAVLLFSPFAWIYLKYSEKGLMKKRKWEFNQQFKQGRRCRYYAGIFMDYKTDCHEQNCRRVLGRVGRTNRH